MIASARSFPAFTCGMAEIATSIVICTWPPITSFSAAEAPLYGTWTSDTPAIDDSSAADMWLVEPVPEEA